MEPASSRLKPAGSRFYIPQAQGKNIRKAILHGTDFNRQIVGNVEGQLHEIFSRHPNGSVFSLANCTGWYEARKSTTKVGSGIAAFVVGSYEDALTEAAMFASLIPIVMSLAGNAGIQASTVTVQAMSAGALWIGDLWGRMAREIVGALLNGGLVGLIVAAGILGTAQIVEIDRPVALALTALLTLVIVTVQASAIDALVPIALERLRFDPAVATGVFITTSNDVLGVLIFFVIATKLYV